jgi:PKD repeat protein
MYKLRIITPFLFTLSLIISVLSAFSQVDRGGLPRSFQSQFLIKSQIQVVDIQSPDLVAIHAEDEEAARLEKSYRVGIEVPVNIVLTDAGQWENVTGGGRICRLTLQCKGAQGLGINFEKVQLPTGSDLFVYTPDKQNVIGAYTPAEIPQNRKFTTRPVYGDKIVVEYFEPINTHERADIQIVGLTYMYRGFEKFVPNELKSTNSGSCEVNVNCEEGQNWQNQKQGAIKILTKVGTKFFYCSGTLMNNTSQDFSGLLLSASHCSNDFLGGSATADDYKRWVFYFNYESPDCISSAAGEQTILGAELLATSDSPSNIGSDFLLLQFLENIPPKYNPYYCGWDAGNSNSSSGVCIHHPDGDIKKISTYTSPLISGTWGSIPNTHWVVRWVATENGHGVTEGGSSGSPLFDEEGLVIGTLTGGESSCQNPTGPDMYGKFSFSWASNGTSADQQLKPWLDPENTGIVKQPGSFNAKLAVADFSASSSVIPVGGTINFQDLSSGKPNIWKWYFQGGNPSESTEQNPTAIRFERFGAMNVKLVVSNEFNTDSIVKEEYIDVRAVVSPNPSKGEVNILTDINNESDVIIEVYDASGIIAQRFEYSGSLSSNYSIKLPDYGNVFLIKVIHGDQLQTHKVIVIH